MLKIAFIFVFQKNKTNYNNVVKKENNMILRKSTNNKRERYAKLLLFIFVNLSVH